jgi:hypothetical protein
METSVQCLASTHFCATRKDKGTPASTGKMARLERDESDMRMSVQAALRVDRGIAVTLCWVARKAPPEGVTKAEASMRAAASTAVAVSVLECTMILFG